jgi:hypothetical protein
MNELIISKLLILPKFGAFTLGWPKVDLVGRDVNLGENVVAFG